MKRASQRAPVNWDKVTALSAVFIGACAVAVSLYTAFLQRSQVEAQTWPFLQLWRSDEARVIYVSNRGVGPARIRDVKVRVDGAEVGTFDEAIAKLASRPARQPMKQSYFARRVLAANEDVRMLELQPDDYQLLRDGAHRLTFDICYCSVLSECYRLDENAQREQDYVSAVKACPVDAPGLFH